MNIEQEIKARIEAAFAPERFELINESHKHAGHAGDDGSGQTHFKLMVVSFAFEGCSRVERQMRVNNTLKSLFDIGLHAISMRLLTPTESK